MGIDVVEVKPAYDSSEITAYLANEVALEALSAFSKRRAGTPYSASRNRLSLRLPCRPPVPNYSPRDEMNCFEISPTIRHRSLHFGKTN